MRPAVFISYSHGDLQFAHWAVRSLAGHGLSSWIDVEQLAPGAQWSLSIDSALDNCDALLLIASAESLASSYCRREWLRAMAAGKRIVLAVIEMVVVPDELTGVPVVDMRAWGPAPWGELARVIQTGASSQRTTLDRLRLPKPMAIAACALVMLFVFQVCLFVQWVGDVAEVLAHVPFWPKALIFSHMVTLIAWIAWTTRWSWRFVHRDATELGLYGMIAVPFLWMLHAIVSPSSTGLAGLPVSVAMYGVLHLAPEVGAWLPNRKRRRHRRGSDAPLAFGAADRPAHTLVPSSPRVCFGIYFAPNDEHVAERIVARMEQHGLQRANSEGSEEVRVVLLSNATPLQFPPLTERHTTSVPIVCVILTAIFVAEEREVLHRYQWVDFRARDDVRIDELARSLRDGRVMDRTPLVPDMRPLTDTILPIGAGFLSIVVTVLASLLMFGSLLRFLEMSFADYSQAPVWSEVSGMGSAVVAASSSAALRGRLVTFSVYACAFGAAFGLLLADAAFQHADSGFYVVSITLAGLLWFGNAHSIRDWLLMRPLGWRLPTIAPHRPWRFLARQVMVPLTAAIAAAVMYASSDAIRGF